MCSRQPALAFWQLGDPNFASTQHSRPTFVQFSWAGHGYACGATDVHPIFLILVSFKVQEVASTVRDRLYFPLSCLKTGNKVGRESNALHRRRLGG